LLIRHKTQGGFPFPQIIIQFSLAPSPFTNSTLPAEQPSPHQTTLPSYFLHKGTYSARQTLYVTPFEQGQTESAVLQCQNCNPLQLSSSIAGTTATGRKRISKYWIFLVLQYFSSHCFWKGRVCHHS